MLQLVPVTLEARGIRLEPMQADHHDALVDASADGRLWELWFTAVPPADGMRQYNEDA